MCEIPKKKRSTGNEKDVRDKEIRSKFKEIKNQYPNYKYIEQCKLTGEFFGIGESSVRKIIEK